jgi:hypothetical protein
MTERMLALYCIAKRIDEYGPNKRSLAALCEALCRLEDENDEEATTAWVAYAKANRLSGTGPHRIHIRSKIRPCLCGWFSGRPDARNSKHSRSGCRP